MLKSIVAHETEDRNSFDAFTESEYAEYEAWLDAKAEVRNPLPQDFDGIYQEQYDYDRWKDEATDEEIERAKRGWPPRRIPSSLPDGDVPFDSELDDVDALTKAGWTRIQSVEPGMLWRERNGQAIPLYCRLNLKSGMIDHTENPPKPVLLALSNGKRLYHWGQSFIYYKYWQDARMEVQS